jgi:hypothetical protein
MGIDAPDFSVVRVRECKETMAYGEFYGPDHMEIGMDEELIDLVDRTS